MPKIDWRDDDQPRRERRRRVAARERVRPGDRARRRDVIEPVLTLAVPARRPLHLIWGVPQPRAAVESS